MPKDKITFGTGLTWRQAFTYYWPNMTDEEIDYFLWEKTPYPFCDSRVILDFIYEVYLGQLKKLGL
jgi:hypothetical protein